MAFDWTKTAGLDPTVRELTTPFEPVDFIARTGASGVPVYGDSAVGSTIAHTSASTFTCSGPKGSVTCIAADGNDVGLTYSIPSFRGAPTGEPQQPISAYLSPDDQVDFYYVHFNATLAITEFPAIACDPGGPGLFDPGPSCVVDSTATVDRSNVNVSTDAGATAGIEWSGSNPPSATQSFVAAVARADVQALWPYQNPDPAFAAVTGRYLFTPEEMAQIVFTTLAPAAARWEIVQHLFIEPFKWAAGYGPPKTRLMCVV